MKRKFLIYVFVLFFSCYLSSPATAQCSICTKTAQQLGDKPARGLNSGILYLAFMPLAIASIIGYRWWRHNRNE